MRLTIETELETDGRYIAEVEELPGVIVAGATPASAAVGAVVLALRVIADKLDHAEMNVPYNIDIKIVMS